MKAGNPYEAEQSGGFALSRFHSEQFCGKLVEDIINWELNNMRIKDKPKIETIIRTCVLCGKHFNVRLFPGGNYTGGNYFTSVGRTKTSKNKPEYWECDDCYNNR